MGFEHLYDFLERLQVNNNKEWMEVNRKEYQTVRLWFINWLTEMQERLVEIDPDYTDTDVKRSINRINNNLMFQPNKPIYKDHFGAGLDLSYHEKQNDFYLQVGVEQSFIAGGFYKPEAKVLKSIREAIDYNGEELIAIIEKPSFKKIYGELYDDGNSLKTAPKGFSKDHEHIDLLRKKTFAVEYPLTREQILSPDFTDLYIKLYKEMKPFRTYLNEAVTV